MSASDRLRARRIADGIVVSHARYRRRVRWALAAGASLAVAAAVPAVVVLAHGAVGRSAGGSASDLHVTASAPVPATGRPPRRHTRSPSPPAPVSNTTERMDAPDVAALVYTVTLRGWQPRGPIRILAASAPQRLRAGLRATLGRRVRFVAAPAGATMLQGVLVDGSRATAQVQDNCGPLCVRGERVYLVRRRGGWQLTGRTRSWSS